MQQRSHLTPVTEGVRSSCTLPSGQIQVQMTYPQTVRLLTIAMVMYGVLHSSRRTLQAESESTCTTDRPAIIDYRKLSNRWISPSVRMWDIRNPHLALHTRYGVHCRSNPSGRIATTYADHRSLSCLCCLAPLLNANEDS